jgi:hypothetical protein
MSEVKKVPVERYEVDGKMFDSEIEANRYLVNVTLGELVAKYVAYRGYTKKNSVTRATNEIMTWEAWKAGQ